MKAMWLSLGLAGLIGCGHAAESTSDAKSQALVLKTYNVPRGYEGQQVQGLLRDALWMPSGKNEGSAVARATLTPDGRILVLGTPGVQEGVSALMSELKESKPAEAPRSVTLHYWIVSAKAAPQVEIAPEVSALESTLGAIAKKDGPQHFELFDHLALSAVSGERSSVRSGRTEIQQLPSLMGNNLSAQLEFELKESSSGRRLSDLKTRVSMDVGKTLVLGQTGMGPEGAPRSNIYYVVRAQLSEATQ